jgi:predicted RNA-binding Zn ribbon-like protein
MTSSPRYDIPRAAPDPLRLIQLFVNTIDLTHDREWLTEWLEEHGVPEPTAADLARARVVREAIRDLLHVNNGAAGDPAAISALNSAANAAMLTIDFTVPGLVARADAVDGALGRVAVVCLESMRDGSWRRLKCCKNSACRWAFYDDSNNRSATWCSMQLCGNRSKTSTYRRGRRRTRA